MPDIGGSVQYEVHNSGLTVEEVREVFPGPVDRATGTTGQRGLTTDMLVAIAENITSDGLTAALAGIWYVWRRRRTRELKAANPVSVRVHVERDDGSRQETVVELPTGAAAVELLTATDPEHGTVRTIRIVFPER
jgi:hypothetical protein